MPQVVDKDSQVFLFADDTRVFRKIRNEKDVTQLQKDIDNLVDWSDKWLLRLHPDKCVSMNIRSKHKDSPPNAYRMKVHILENSKCENDIYV